MNIETYEADIFEQRDIIEEVLNRNRNYAVSSERFDWLYLKNPNGIAKVWLARDGVTGKIIGASAALPRLFWIKKNLKIIYILSDFSIDQKYRSLGPAIKLNKATLSGILSKDVPIVCDFPAKGMETINKWMKATLFSPLTRHLLPLVPSEFYKKKVSVPLPWSIIDSVYKIYFLSASKLMCRNCVEYELEIIRNGTFDTAFDALDRNFGPSYDLYGSRNSNYLNWRYGQNPLEKYYLMKIIEQNKLKAYLIYMVTKNNRIRIYDIMASLGEDILNKTVNAIIKIGIDIKAAGIEIPLPNNSRWMEIFKLKKFIAKEVSAKMYTFTNQNVEILSEKSYITIGDKDT